MHCFVVGTHSVTGVVAGLPRIHRYNFQALWEMFPGCPGPEHPVLHCFCIILAWKAAISLLIFCNRLGHESMSTFKELMIALPCPLLCVFFLFCFVLFPGEHEAPEMPTGEVLVAKQHSLVCFDNLIMIQMPSTCKELFWCHIMISGQPAGRENEEGITVLK